MTDQANPVRQSYVRQALCLAPGVRAWFAERDRLAEDAGRWRALQSRAVTAAKADPADQAALLALMACLTPRRPLGFDKIRVGRSGDGGYVMLDDLAGVCAALSFGIADDCSWDSAIAERGIDIDQYDHSVDGPPAAHARFRFFRTAIGGRASDGFETLGTCMAKLPPPEAGALILKIDIEGAEWDVLDAATPEELGRFTQILGEFHGFHTALDPQWRARALRVLRKLRAVFDLVHIHANNFGTLAVIANVPVADVVELSFANRARYRSEDACEVFPTPLDQPNFDQRADICLGTMRFG